MADREPVGSSARLTGEMPHTADHASHDLLLIAALADGTSDPSEQARAEVLVRDCADCAALHDDLLAIRTATVALPTPRRTRDFRLTDADVVRLRPRGWRRLIGLVGSGRDAVSRPLAVGLTTLGIAGLLVATIPAMWTGLAETSGSAAGLGTTGSGAASAKDQAAPPVVIAGGAATSRPSDLRNGVEASAAASAAAPSPGSAFGGDTAASASAGPIASRVPVPAATAEVADGGGSAEATDGSVAAVPTSGAKAVASPLADALADAGQAAGSAAPSALIVLSLGFLIGGLALFLLRWSARRTTF